MTTLDIFLSVVARTSPCRQTRAASFQHLLPVSDIEANHAKSLSSEFPGITFTWWACCGLCQKDMNQPSLPTSFYSVLVSLLSLYGPFNGTSFQKFSRKPSTFLLCSSGLISALLVLSTIYLFVDVSGNPINSDVVPGGSLGSKH